MLKLLKISLHNAYYVKQNVESNVENFKNRGELN